MARVGGGRHGGGGRSFGGGGGGRGFGGGYHRPPRRHYHGGFYGGYYGRGGFFGGAISLVIVIIFFMLFFVLIHTADADPNITESTKNRTKMDGAYLQQKCDIWYEDTIDLVEYASDQYNLEEALQYFYDTTGVQPYLWIIDNVGGDTTPSVEVLEAAMLAKYSTLFGEDEGHLLFVFFLYPDQSYDLWYVVGSDAEAQVLDDEALTILLDCVDYHYYEESTCGAVFTAAFRDAADRIMGGKESSAVLPIVIVVIVVVVILGWLIYKYVQNRKAENGTNDGERGPQNSDGFSDGDRGDYRQSEDGGKNYDRKRY